MVVANEAWEERHLACGSVVVDFWFGDSGSSCKLWSDPVHVCFSDLMKEGEERCLRLFYIP